MNLRMLRKFIEVYPYQPATAIWRAPEVAELASIDFPRGIGLDLGCGDGRLTRVLSEEVGGLRLVGLDLDPQETALAEQEGFYERIHTSPADHIPEPEGVFDFVLSVSVMEHIPNLQNVLSEVARVLKPGGRLITTVPSIGFHACLRGPLIPGASRAQYLRAVDLRVAHLRYWTTAEWKGALAAAGLRLTEARPILSAGDVRRWETVARFTAGVLHVMMRHKAPIDIQRSLGLRQSSRRLPPMAARHLARLLSLGLDNHKPTDEASSGCLLIIATRPAD